MPTGFIPERQPVTMPGTNLMQPLWLDFNRRQQRATDTVLSGDTSSSSATGSSSDIDVAGNGLRCDNSSLLTLLGLLSTGDRVRSFPIWSGGAGIVEIIHESGSAPSAQRFDTGSGVTLRLCPGRGAAWVHWDSVASRWQVINHTQGGKIDQTFAAGDYNASSGVWTVGSGDVASNAYTLVGRMLHLSLRLAATTVSATPNSLTLLIPGGYTAGNSSRQLVAISDNGTPGIGLATVTAGVTAVTITRQDAASFSASANATDVTGELSFEVQA